MLQTPSFPLISSSSGFKGVTLPREQIDKRNYQGRRLHREIHCRIIPIEQLQASDSRQGRARGRRLGLGGASLQGAVLGEERDVAAEAEPVRLGCLLKQEDQLQQRCHKMLSQ